MQIGRVAESTGLSVDTTRFYKKQGLVPQAQRTAAGYRVYEEMDVDRLRRIGRAQSLGFSLKEIRELLLIEDGKPGGCSHVRDLLAAKIDQVQEKIAGLRQIEQRLAKAEEQCGAALIRSCDAECPVLAELESGQKGELQ